MTIRKAMLICLVAVIAVALAGCFTVKSTATHATATPQPTASASYLPIVTAPPASATASPLPSSAPTPTAAPSPKPQDTGSSGAQKIEFPKTGAAALTQGVPYLVDPDDDGKSQTIKVYYDSTTDLGMVELGVTDSGRKETRVSEEGALKSAYYYQNAFGGACVLLSLDGCSDDYFTVVYELGRTNASKVGSVSGYVMSMDGEELRVFDLVDMLGTWESYRDYRVGNSFALEPAGDALWHVTQEGSIVVKKDLPVQMLYSSTTYKAATLSAGTAMRITATDGATFVRFELEDGRKGRLDLTKSGWQSMIEGIPEEEWFEELPYSG